ncbi:MAG: hypothetical protein AAGD43_16300 [Pseudomonadota bacterium]
MALIASIFKIGIGSFWGRMVGVALLAWGALLANNAYQRHVGGNARESQIVKNTNEKARERDDQIRKDRRNRPLSGARKRLRDKYSRSN